jgi:hypothetical protein
VECLWFRVYDSGFWSVTQLGCGCMENVHRGAVCNRRRQGDHWVADIGLRLSAVGDFGWAPRGSRLGIWGLG